METSLWERKCLWPSFFTDCSAAYSNSCQAGTPKASVDAAWGSFVECLGRSRRLTFFCHKFFSSLMHRRRRAPGTYFCSFCITYEPETPWFLQILENCSNISNLTSLLHIGSCWVIVKVLDLVQSEPEFPARDSSAVIKFWDRCGNDRASSCARCLWVSVTLSID